MEERLKKFIPIVFILPLVIGTAGYIISGEMFTNAVYSGVALYFVSPVSDGYNWLIEVARWTAPLVTATAILYALKNVFNNIKWRLAGFSKDSVAVYTDDDKKIKFDGRTKAIYPGDKFKGYMKSQIILFSSDKKSLEFYEQHKQKMDARKVYIGLNDLETGMLKGRQNVVFFDINSSISRKLWRDIAVWNSDDEKKDIVIYGNGLLAQNILNTGLQLNLFSKKQKITYYQISDSFKFSIRYPHMDLCNGDKILNYTCGDDAIWEIIEKADIVIVADEVSLELLQFFASRNRDGDLYYYSPDGVNIGDYIEFGSPIPFGCNEEVFTDDNIRREKVILNAKKLHESYVKEYGMDEKWSELSGFLKNSNISSADYQEVMITLPETKTEDELAELEHIRWCRFHYLNYWKNGVVSTGASKDAKKRIHTCLIPYDMLSEEEKSKDKNIIKTFRENKN